MKTGSLLGVALLAAFITYCFRQPAAARALPAREPMPRALESPPDRDGEIEPTVASPAARTPGSAPPYLEGDPTVRH
jgi:hypothetical protein